MPLISAITSLANPSRFASFADRALPWIAGAAALTFAVALYLALFVAPPDYQQGETVRIMFIHVPSAWLAMFAYVIMAAASLGVLVWRHPIADVSAKAAAPLGAAFTFLALATGSLWGKPMWGTWWVWDARLTSFLILFLMYLGIMALRSALEEPSRAAKACAILTLVGSVNIPIIKFSVDWWNTLHQPASVIRAGKPAMDPSILTPLLVAALAFTLLFTALHLAGMRTELMRRRLRTLRLTAAARPAARLAPEPAR
ncbi:heme exporter protein CcmC [Methylopila jiangsuensis]|uniref:Heme exporter protein C n=1 Tax=Methylopila jiangsuensis TaxID=586230 RepID=A0A9W6N4C9_9HYPH|nr:heme ABC transporter permease [Methylopila jiangsuensis]MDR6286636.1 heme exporter protein C [Methylopila jiangsuensis]GLK77022.1 heme exporter protein CcmC [Methylopila jiangsuensis]